MNVILSSLLLTFLVFTYGCSDGGRYLDNLIYGTDEYIKDLDSGNIMVKNDAVFNLGENKEKIAVPKLIELLRNNESKQTRLSVIEALGKIFEEDSAVDALIEILTGGDKDLRISAVDALGKIKDPKAIPFLIDSLKDEDVQIVAIWALGNIGDKGSFDALSRLLDNKDEYVRYNAIQALKKIGRGE